MGLFTPSILVQLIELFYAHPVTSAVKRCFQPCSYQFQGKSFSDNTPAQHQYIGIVVTPAHNRAKKIAAKRRPHVRESVGDHGHADSGAAKEYTALEFSG